MFKVSRAFSAASLAAAAVLAANAAQSATPKPAPQTPAASQPLPATTLAGRWAGQGVLTLASGPAEAFKCVVTYFPSSDGTKVKQNLRCRGTQNRLDTATLLSIEGERVTGQWQDNVYSLAGTVSGSTNGRAFNLLLNGDYFQATMQVESSGCEQTVRVVPRDTSMVREVAANLRRC